MSKRYISAISQFTLDELLLAKAQINNLVEVAGNDKQDYLDLPNFNWIYKWNSPDNLQSWYKKGLYQKYYNDFKRLQAKWVSEQYLYANLLDDSIRLPSCQTGDNCIKIRILTELMDLSASLAENDDHLKGMQFRQLKAQLYLYLSPTDQFILDASGIKKDENPSILVLAKKYLQSTLRLLIQNRRINLKRDLRQHFRSIVHFLFKNMADETDHVNFLFSKNSDKKLITQISFHGIKGHH